MNKFLNLLITIVLLSFTLEGVSAEKLVFATSDWPPYIFMENNQPTGIHVEIVREACKRLGFEADIKVVPWARAVKYVEEGQQATAIFSLKKNAERTEFLYFPTEPIDIEKNVLIAQKQSAIQANSLDALKDKMIGVVRGYTYDPKFDSNETLKKEEAVDDVQMMKKLDKRRTDLATGEEGTLKYIRKQLNLQEIETAYVLSESPTYVAFSKKALDDNGVAFTEKFGQMLRQLKEEGFVQKIKDKYL